MNSNANNRLSITKQPWQLTDTIVADDEELEEMFLEVTEMRQHEVRFSPGPSQDHAHRSIRLPHHTLCDKLVLS